MWPFIVANLEGQSLRSRFHSESWSYVEFQNIRVEYKGRKHTYLRNHVGRVRIENVCKLPPETEVIVTSDRPLYGQNCMIEPVVNLSKKGLLAARSMLNENGDTVCSLINLTTHPVKLQAGEIIGHICPVEEQECLVEDRAKSTSEFIIQSELPEHLQCVIDGLSPSLSATEREQFSKIIIE